VLLFSKIVLPSGKSSNRVVTGIRWTPGNAVMLALFIALGAMSHPARDTASLQVLKAGFIVWELLEESL